MKSIHRAIVIKNIKLIKGLTRLPTIEINLNTKSKLLLELRVYHK